jgi:hypothetical protein
VRCHRELYLTTSWRCPPASGQWLVGQRRHHCGAAHTARNKLSPSESNISARRIDLLFSCRYARPFIMRCAAATFSSPFVAAARFSVIGQPGAAAPGFCLYARILRSRARGRKQEIGSERGCTPRALSSLGAHKYAPRLATAKRMSLSQSMPWENKHMRP